MTFLRAGNTEGKLVLILAVLAIAVSTLFLELRHTPRYEGLGADSGLFAYGGQQILQGKLLYRDVWDNKPPGVFYINALITLFGGANPWAIWWANGLWIALTTIILFFTLDKIAGRVPSFLVSMLFLMTVMYPDYYQGGNFTEIYALLPQVLSIWTVSRYYSTRKNYWIVLLGVMAAAAFLFKPTYIALPVAGLAVLLYLDMRRGLFRQVAIHLIGFVLGVAVPLGIVALYWVSQGAFQLMWDAVITYNRQYMAQGFSNTTFQETLRILTRTQPIATVFTLSLASLVLFLVTRWRDLLFPGGIQPAASVNNRPSSSWIYAGVFLALPAEWLFVSLSGRNFGHYFLTPLPAMLAGSAYLFSEIIHFSFQPRIKGLLPRIGLALVTILFLAWCINIYYKERPNRGMLTSALTQPLYGTYQPTELEQYVLDHSSPSQSVLVWAIHQSINYLTSRRSPSRYLFQNQFLVPTYNTKSIYAQFMSDLQNDPPVLILAQPDFYTGLPFFEVTEDRYLCPACTADIRAELLVLKSYIKEHYILTTSIWDWQIYSRTN